MNIVSAPVSTIAVKLSPKPQVLPSMVSRDDCQTNPAWQAWQAAWELDGTDNQSVSWWSSVSSTPNTSFANTLGKDFGGHLNAFECGIGAYSTCTVPPCSDWITTSPAWAYQLILAVVNLNTFFNNLYSGIDNGQTDYLGLTKDMAQTFFPWKNPTFILGDASFWIVALLTAILAVPSEFAAGPAIAIAMDGIGAFVGAGVQQITYTLQPDSTASESTITQSEADLDKFSTTAGEATRTTIVQWANKTFLGQPDPLKQTILSYLHNGSFSNPLALPTVTQIEAFYKSQMVSRQINTQWFTKKIFIMFHQTNDSNDTSGPLETRYYSAQDGGVYYLYWYQETGNYKGKLAKPWGLDSLNQTTYGITGTDITKASARAYRIAGFNYTQDIAKNRIMSSMTSNGALTPFQDGPGWEGTWTIPVCDTGIHNWQSQYDDSSSQYGMLPCCCGPNCNMTADFVQAAKMKGFQTLLKGCKEQLKGSDVVFGNIDYGFQEHTASAGGVVGVFFLLFLIAVVVSSLAYCLWKFFSKIRDCFT